MPFLFSLSKCKLIHCHRSFFESVNAAKDLIEFEAVQNFGATVMERLRVTCSQVGVIETDDGAHQLTKNYRERCGEFLYLKVRVGESTT